MFAVLQLNKTVEVSIYGCVKDIPLTYADGMIGAIPVFETLEKAQEFAGEKYGIAEIMVSSNARDNPPQPRRDCGSEKDRTLRSG